MSGFRQYNAYRRRKRPIKKADAMPSAHSLSPETVSTHMGLIVDVAHAYFQSFRKFGFTRKDVIQLATLGVMKRIAKYNGRSAVGTFIPMAIESEFHDALRSLKRRRKEKVMETASTELGSRAYFIRPSSDASTIAERIDLALQLRARAQAVLSPKLWHFFELRVIKGYSIERIAQELNLSHPAVKAMFGRMVKALRSDSSIQSLLDPSVSKKRQMKADSTD